MAHSINQEPGPGPGGTVIVLLEPLNRVMNFSDNITSQPLAATKLVGFYNNYNLLAEPAGLAPHSNVYLSVPGGSVVFDKTVFPAYGGGRGLV